MEPQWLTWAKELQAIAQAGLEYSKDDYDLERFEMIRNISLDILHQYTDIEHTKLGDLFTNEIGYATPKVDVRGVAFQEEQILLVKEKSDKKWTLPGGWCDIGLSPSENVIKEMKEESGYDVVPLKLLGILDKQKHRHPPSPYAIYKIFILVNIIGGQPAKNIETIDVDFFALDDLPPLSQQRITIEQITWAFEHLHNPNKPVFFD